MALLRRLVRTFFFFCLMLCRNAHGSLINDEEFSEELLLKPFPDRKVLAHFHFESKAPVTSTYGRHCRIFPKTMYQLVQKFQVRELELSFTQGRWNYERWGGFDPISSNNAKPPGVELWAVFDAPRDQVDALWKNLTHALSGLFCASINFLESSATYSSPDWSFRPFTGSLRYGSLPREAVCTENLTPWLKLLPCRDKAGLSALMDRPSIYSGFYHSQRLHLTTSEYDSPLMESGIVLEQTLTVVVQPNGQRTSYGEKKMQPSWSISSIFGRKVGGKCVLAKSSLVYFHLEGDLVGETKSLQGKEEEKEGILPADNSRNNPGFELSVTPDRLIEEVNNPYSKGPSVFYEFLVEKYSESDPFDLEFIWKFPIVWSCPQAPLLANRFLMGTGNERGAIAISFKSTDQSRGIIEAGLNSDSCTLRVDLFQVVPWYIKVYFHTLQVFVDEQPREVGDIIGKMHFSPSEDKVSPGVMEMILNFPCGVKSASLTLAFDKGFLHVSEYPPDANQGFDIPSAVINFPNFQASMQFPDDGSSVNSTILSMFQKRNPVMSYTEILLVPLTTPDFSMPYNVITITCTVYALYFGSLLNALRRRVGEEERLLKSKASKKTGLIPQLFSRLSGKFIRRPPKSPQISKASSSLCFLNTKLIFRGALVVAIACAWQFYFS